MHQLNLIILLHSRFNLRVHCLRNARILPSGDRVSDPGSRTPWHAIGQLIRSVVLLVL
jgi:hypothetical protein